MWWGARNFHTLYLKVWHNQETEDWDPSLCSTRSWDEVTACVSNRSQLQNQSPKVLFSVSFPQSQPSVSSRDPAAWRRPVTLRTRTTCPGTATSPATTTCCLYAPAPRTATASPCTATAPRCPAAPPARCSRHHTPPSSHHPHWTSAPSSSTNRKLNWGENIGERRRTFRWCFIGTNIYLCVRECSVLTVTLLIFYHCILSKLLLCRSILHVCVVFKTPHQQNDSRGNSHGRMRSSAPLFWWADLFWCVRGSEDGKSTAKATELQSDGVAGVKSVWVEAREDWGPLHAEWRQRGLQACVDSSGEKVLIALIKYVKKCTQTAVW